MEFAVAETSFALEAVAAVGRAALGAHGAGTGAAGSALGAAGELAGGAEAVGAGLAVVALAVGRGAAAAAALAALALHARAVLGGVAHALAVVRALDADVAVAAAALRAVGQVRVAARALPGLAVPALVPLAEQRQLGAVLVGGFLALPAVVAERRVALAALLVHAIPAPQASGAIRHVQLCAVARERSVLALGADLALGPAALGAVRVVALDAVLADLAVERQVLLLAVARGRQRTLETHVAVLAHAGFAVRHLAVVGFAAHALRAVTGGVQFVALAVDFGDERAVGGALVADFVVRPGALEAAAVQALGLARGALAVGLAAVRAAVGTQAAPVFVAAVEAVHAGVGLAAAAVGAGVAVAAAGAVAAGAEAFVGRAPALQRGADGRGRQRVVGVVRALPQVGQRLRLRRVWLRNRRLGVVVRLGGASAAAARVAVTIRGSSVVKFHYYVFFLTCKGFGWIRSVGFFDLS